jgi:hypothetical protein
VASGDASPKKGDVGFSRNDVTGTGQNFPGQFRFAGATTPPLGVSVAAQTAAMRDRAFRRDVFLSLPYFDGAHRFLSAPVRREGLDVACVDVVDRPRLRSDSNYGLWNRLWVAIIDMMGVWWLVRRITRVPQAGELKLVE